MDCHERLSWLLTVYRPWSIVPQTNLPLGSFLSEMPESVSGK
jgi:hypothetical protein